MCERLCTNTCVFNLKLYNFIHRYPKNNLTALWCQRACRFCDTCIWENRTFFVGQMAESRYFFAAQERERFL